MPPPTPLLILAYGNPLRGDDGVGWAVGGKLAAILPEEAAEVIVQHQLTPELAEPISRAAQVIFVDAAEGDEPGAIGWAEVQPGASSHAFTHQVEPASLLAAAQELYGRAPVAAHLLTITGGDFGYSEGLSPAVERAVEEAVTKIIQHSDYAPPPNLPQIGGGADSVPFPIWGGPRCGG